ncbi:CTLH/CRA C-terminal to lish motif domain-containing protein [Schizophyllum amplum]|uniref:CTLH/CRA C-terminal to lish motif domain-containing protein n=1 Tax=Schizophyllum amplum TaxID=97359 RepID=A0A550CFN2_9AGAR|nr:CTLH/CRA C-terminal to lish motif domain-containing protein [Auriculariopsis ampla]
MAHKISEEGTLLLEQPFVRVPYENYRKIFRTSQKHVERELQPVQTSAAKLAKDAEAGSLQPAQAMESIDAMIARVENLKRKLAELNETAGKPTQDVMRARLQHLHGLSTFQDITDPEYNRWADTRLDRWLVDWTLRTGRVETAREIARRKGIESLVDIDLFTEIRRIEGALHVHSCTEALAWCSENKVALRKIKSTLEFELRLQEFIELCRQRSTTQAIAYSKKHLIAWQETHLPQIQHALALLAYAPGTSCGPYKRLYDLSRWDTLVRSFRNAVYALNTLSPEPLLHLALYAGLSSLKLRSCYVPHSKNADCPICDGAGSGPVAGHPTNLSHPTSLSHPTGPQGLAKLAEEVPFSHHINSTIVCRITGNIMDEDNPPMAFPSGRVYSRGAMEEMAARNGGIVTSPDTGEEVEFGELRKVFIS